MKIRSKNAPTFGNPLSAIPCAERLRKFHERRRNLAQTSGESRCRGAGCAVHPSLRTSCGLPILRHRWRLLFRRCAPPRRCAGSFPEIGRRGRFSAPRFLSRKRREFMNNRCFMDHSLIGLDSNRANRSTRETTTSGTPAQTDAWRVPLAEVSPMNALLFQSTSRNFSGLERPVLAALAGGACVLHPSAVSA